MTADEGKIFIEVSALVSAIYKSGRENMMGFVDELFIFNLRLEEDLGYKVDEYRLWHAVVGSTPRGECDYFDFPGEDSIEKFVRGFAERCTIS